MGIKGTAAGLYSGAGVVVVLAGLVIADICTTGGLIVGIKQHYDLRHSASATVVARSIGNQCGHPRT